MTSLTLKIEAKSFWRMYSTAVKAQLAEANRRALRAAGDKVRSAAISNLNNYSPSVTRPWIRTGDLINSLRLDGGSSEYMQKDKQYVVLWSQFTGRHAKPWRSYSSAPYGAFLEEGFTVYNGISARGKVRKTYVQYPWLRPAFNEQSEEAMRAFERTFYENF